ncbi:hypothetical protein H0N99_02895 [Candidatus Micrarchaeota archaeon]|nr:hypothetical protein [Candidatus Micrarchaeota archaeon]
MNFKILFLCILLLGCSGLYDMRSACQNALDAGVKDRCFSALAMRDESTTECNDVQNATMREYCMMRIAIVHLSESDCGSMETLRDQCVHVVAGLKQNASLVCRLIEDNDTADLCRMRVM